MAGTLAIDLGSSTTVVAWQPPGEAARLLALPPFSTVESPLIPSLLWQASPDQRQPLIGRQVLEAGLIDHGGPGLCRDFKRLIGAPCPSAADDAPIPGRPWLSPERAGELLLHRLWQALPDSVTPERLVLTAPIDSYRGYRSWLHQACAPLAVPELALVDEPTAAAIGAGLAPGSRVLVVDLGGGTTDLALVELPGGEGKAAPIAQLLRFAGRNLERSGQVRRCARVIGKAGLAFGGRDIDRWIAAHLVPDQPSEPSLLQVAERLKCRLSSTDSDLQLWAPPGERPRELRLDRASLEQLLHRQGLPALLDNLLTAVLSAARRESLGDPRIDAVLPVGGSSQMPLIRRWLAERLPGIPVRGERPVEAVALGALALTPGVGLRDVLTRGIALRCWDRRSGRHHWHPLFVAGQSWPTDQPLELVLAASRNDQASLELVLGEPVPEDRQEVVFRAGLPQLRARPAGPPRVEPWPSQLQPEPVALDRPGRQGEDQIRLQFSINTSGQLVVAGENLHSGYRLSPRPLGPVR